MDEVNTFAGFSDLDTTGKFIWTTRCDKNGKFFHALSSVGFWSNDHQSGMVYSPTLIVRKGDTFLLRLLFISLRYR